MPSFFSVHCAHLAKLPCTLPEIAKGPHLPQEALEDHLPSHLAFGNQARIAQYLSDISLHRSSMKFDVSNLESFQRWQTLTTRWRNSKMLLSLGYTVATSTQKLQRRLTPRISARG
jgi:hypothetical protein